MNAKEKEIVNVDGKDVEINGNETTSHVAKVMSVLASDKFNNKRISFVVELSADSPKVVQIEDGKESETNVISLSSGQIGQCHTNVEFIDIADSLAMGSAVNRQIYSLCCKGAVIEFDRVFVPKGTKNLKGELTERDVWSTRLKSVKNTLSPMVQNLVMNLINTQLLEKEPPQEAPNINNVAPILPQ